MNSLTLKEVSAVLGIKVRTLRAWVDEGKIPAQKIGRCLMVPESIVYSKEVQERANKGREHSRRIKEGRELGVLAGRSEDTEESV